MLSRALLWIFCLAVAGSAFGKTVVPIPPAMRACKKASDCKEVMIDCGSCCGMDAINGSKLKEFIELSRQACENYVGAVCDCTIAPGKLECVNGACKRTVLKRSPREKR